MGVDLDLRERRRVTADENLKAHVHMKALAGNMMAHHVVAPRWNLWRRWRTYRDACVFARRSFGYDWPR